MSRDFSAVANQICILRLSALGDCCHALGAINRLKKEMPDAEITWVVGKNEFELFKLIQFHSNSLNFAQIHSLSAQTIQI